MQLMVQKRVECAEHARSKREPLIPTSLPAYPRQVVETDLFDSTCWSLIIFPFFRN